MKSHAIFCGFLFVMCIFSCSQKQEKSAETNSIPYPLDEWKGVQGKTLADSKPFFVGPHQAPVAKKL